ncbi:MAG TPA: CPBP family intramembrane glutamic endopeptidase [Rhizomicrobium sp.]|nr:CPBP family intramembrane glutamic endopeptidase [Rhizomicrobium sp.]
MEQGDTNAAGDAPFALKPLPILIALLLFVGISVVSAVTIYIAEHFMRLIERPEMPWIFDGYVELAQLAFAYLAIRWLRRTHPGDYGLRLPDGDSYVPVAILWAVFFGVLMTLVDYWPQLIAHKPPEQPYPLTSFNITGWLSFQGVIAGPSDEVLLRGLIMTYLMMAMPGRITVRGYAMSGAGVVVAALYALAHLGNFFLLPFGIAFGQVVYMFAQGILFAYWYEKSRSLVAPIIGHSLAGMIQQGLIFAMVAAWSSPHAF